MTGVAACILFTMVFHRARGRVVRNVVLPCAVLLTLIALFAAASMNRDLAVRPVAQVSDYINAELAAKPQGVDASKWQHPGPGAVDWQKAAADGKKFAFLKVTDTYQRDNDHFDNDLAQAREAGLYVGAYHKAHPGSDATRQATVFSEAVVQAGGLQLPPVLDLELDEGLSPSQLHEWTRTFMKVVKDKTGRTPIMYTYKSFWLVQMANTKEFSEYPLWLAEYRQQQPTQPLIGGWDKWTFWQFAGNDGRADGFSTPVDLNVFNGTDAQLQALVGPVGPGAAGAQQEPSPTTDTPAPTDTEGATSGAPSGTSGTSGTDSGATDAQNANAPLTITIPDIGIPASRLPAGITLPMTITLPAALTGALGTGSADGAVSDFRFILDLLGSLPADALKSALVQQ